MSLWPIWDNFRPLEAVVIPVMLLLAYSAVERSRTSSTNRYLLLANWGVVLALFLSLSPVYKLIDPLLGGHNFTNLIQRALVTYAGFAVTYSLAKMSCCILKEEARPWCMSRLWPVLAAAGLVYSFMDMQAVRYVSRGLEGFAHHYIGFTLYQVSTLLGLLAGTRYLVPRLLKIAREYGDTYMKVELRIFVASYIGVALTVVLFVFSPLSPVLVGIREALIYLTFTSLAVGFILINYETRQAAVAVTVVSDRPQRV